jgi:arabinose-5-phosphate isomerase
MQAPEVPATTSLPDRIGWARSVLLAEAQAITDVARNLPDALARVVDQVATTPQPVMCCGVGKSGLVAAKVAATLSSLGCRAFALPAGDAAHGDLGAVAPGSIVLIFSNSGATTEILRIAPSLRARGCLLVGLLGRTDGPLARLCDEVIPLPVAREADHLGLAPTASTTAQMAMGDAIAVAASRQRGFTRADFLRAHPAGLLGRHDLPVDALMRTGEALPTVLPHMALAEVIGIMTAGRMGAACVTDWDGKLCGLIVDGDIRRVVQARGDLYAVTAASVMKPDPVVLRAGVPLSDALTLVRGYDAGLLVLPVVDGSGSLVGMVHSLDLVQTP